MRNYGRIIYVLFLWEIVVEIEKRGWLSRKLSFVCTYTSIVLNGIPSGHEMFGGMFSKLCNAETLMQLWRVMFIGLQEREIVKVI